MTPTSISPPRVPASARFFGIFLWLLACAGPAGCSDEGTNDDVEDRPGRARQAAVIVPAPPEADSRNLVIKQIAMPSPSSDSFVELYNNGDTRQSLRGLVLHTSRFSPQPGIRWILPDVYVWPRQSFLIAWGTRLRVPPDLLLTTGSGPFSSGSGVVSITRGYTECTSNTDARCLEQQQPYLVDMVGFGSSTQFEGAPAEQLTLSMSAIGRNSSTAGVYTDTNNNLADFITKLPVPRNTVAGYTCNSTQTDPRRSKTIDRRVPTSFAAAAEPLLAGTFGAITSDQLAVVQGRVRFPDGRPAPCFAIDVVEKPEYGIVTTFADGTFALPVRGGGRLTVRMRPKPQTCDGTECEAPARYYSAQRTVDTWVNRFSDVPEFVLIEHVPGQEISALATATTPVTGALEQDANGSRRANLLFPAGTFARVEGEISTRNTYRVAVKEVTNLSSYGRNGMPASLPPQSGFTYAVELSVEGAEEKDVTFEKADGTPQKVPVYVDNFLSFPTGAPVPAGRYDRKRAVWITEESGRVIRIASVDAQGNAVLDLGTGATEAGLGITTAEKQSLGTLRSQGKIGTSIWRFRAQHFSTWDLNWTFDPEPAVPNLPPLMDDSDAEESECKKPGSIVDCESRVLRERIPIAGTNFTLNYSSARQPGQKRLLIPVTGGGSLQHLDLTIRLKVEVAGRVFEYEPPLVPNYVHKFVWDGVDVAGRMLSGPQPVVVTLDYIRPGNYLNTPNFGDPPVRPGQPRNAFLASSNGRVQVVGRQIRHGMIGTVDASYAGLGGWTLDVHHAFSPSTGAIFLGNGTSYRLGAATRPGRVAGTGLCGGPHVPGFPADENRIYPENSEYSNFQGLGPIYGRVAFDDRGVVHIADTANRAIRRVVNGQLQIVYRDVNNFSAPTGLAIAANGDMYVTDHVRGVARITQSGAYTRLIPVAVNLAIQDGPLGTATSQNPLDVALSPDGSVYIAELGNHSACVLLGTAHCGAVRRIFADRVQTILTPRLAYRLAAARDGSLYVLSVAVREPGQTARSYIEKISTSGEVTVVAGNVTSAVSGDRSAEGRLATEVNLGFVSDLALGPDGLLTFVQWDHGLVRRISGDGRLETIAGSGRPPPQNIGCGAEGEGCATPEDIVGVSIAPDGAPYFSSAACTIDSPGSKSITAIGNTPDAVFAHELALTVLSPDAQQLYQFDVATGRHVETSDAHTNVPIYSFGYNTAGDLTSITDSDGRVTSLTRSRVLLIAPPDGGVGQRTALSVSNGSLLNLTQPDGGRYSFTYYAGNLLQTLKDPKAEAEGLSAYEFSYQDGALTSDKDPRPGVVAQTLFSVADAAGVTVTHTSPGGKLTTYRRSAPGSIGSLTVTRPDQLASTRRQSMHLQPVFDAGISGTNGYDTVLSQPDGTNVFMRHQKLADHAIAPRAVETALRLPSGKSRVRKDEPVLVWQPSTGQVLQHVVNTRFNDEASASTLTFSLPDLKYTFKSAEQRLTTQLLDAVGRPKSFEVAGVLPLGITYEKGQPKTLVQGDREVVLDYFASGAKAGHLERITRRVRGSATALQVVTQDVDSFGRVLTSTVVTATEAFAFDGNGNQRSVTPPGRPAHTLISNAVNLLTSYTPPPPVTGAAGPWATIFAHDADRKIESETRPDGVTLTWTRDSFGRADRLTFPGGVIDYDFYGATPPAGGSPGLISAIRGPYGVNLAFKYDGRLTTEVAWSGTIAGTLSATYDNRFRLATRNVAPGTVSETIGYDLDDLVTNVTFNAGGATRSIVLTRDHPAGLITAITTGPVVEQRSYNQHGELSKQIGNKSVPLSTPLFEAYYEGGYQNGPVVPRDALGRIRNMVGGSCPGVCGFSYDSVGRLWTRTVNGSLVDRFEYDTNGNFELYKRGSVTRFPDYDEQDRVTTWGPWTQTFGRNGELKSETNGASTYTYDFDAKGNLLRVSTAGLTVEYLIDGVGRRVGKKLNGTLVKRWLYKDDLAPIAELDGAGNLVSRFIYASNPHVPDVVVRGGKTYRLFSDHQGSPIVAVNVDNTSEVPFRATYSPFGYPTGTGLGWIPFGFAGGLYDPDTSLIRFGAREYYPTSGRWMQKDPLRFEGGQTNLYAYAGNDPVNHADRTGKIFFLDTILCAYYSWRMSDTQEECYDHVADAWATPGLGNEFFDAVCESSVGERTEGGGFPETQYHNCLARKDPDGYKALIDNCAGVASAVAGGATAPGAGALGMPDRVFEFNRRFPGP